LSTSWAPQLEKRNDAQLAALPLGSRIHLVPWDDLVDMKAASAAVLESARDKMPFEVTPAFPNLVRFDGVKQESARNASNAAPAK